MIPSECKADVKCKYDEAAAECKPAGSETIGDCGAIQDPGKCTGANVPPHGCRWDSKKTPPVCVKKDAPKTVYVWNKLSNPAGDVVMDFSKVVLSGDGILYGMNENAAAGDVGLWFKPKDSDWAPLTIPAGGPGPKEGATPVSVELDTKTAMNTIRLHATKDGAALTKGPLAVILKGGDVVWALDSRVHNSLSATLDPDKQPEVIGNSPFDFSAVVETPDNQALLLQQYSSSLKKLIFQSTENLQEMKRMLLTTKGGSAIKVKLHAAANDDTKGLILGGDADSVINKWVVIHVPAALNKPGIAGSGKTDAGVEGVLFSSFTGSKWVNSETEAMTLVGKIGEYYLANRVGQTPAGPLGGIFTHKGPQASGAFGASPDLSFDTNQISGTSQFGGVLRMVSKNDGLLGANAELKPDPKKNFTFETYKDSVLEMNTDRESAIDLDSTQDKNLSAILGNDDLAYFVVKGKGIYSRTKDDKGQPRLK